MKPPIPSSTTFHWVQKEAGNIANGVRLIVESQLGNTGRRLQKKCSEKCLQTIVCGGNVVDPLNPSASSNTNTVSEAFERANVVAAGIRTFAELLSKGVYPGYGGYTVSPTGEKVFGSPMAGPNIAIGTLKTIADLLAKGALAPPSSPVPNLLMLGNLAQQALGGQIIPAQFNPFGKMPTATTSKLPMAKNQPSAPTGLTSEEEQFLLRAAESVNDLENAKKSLHHETVPVVEARPQRKYYKPSLPINFSVEVENSTNLLDSSKESKVPSTRIGRLATFGQLAFGLAGGAAAEVTRRTFGAGQEVLNHPANPFLSTANADRIVDTLCRVRGAALKLGQMISLQDSEFVSPAVLEIFERVRQSADYMPIRQVHRQMEDAFGSFWRDNFESFDDKPFAAASIGQVHKAVMKDGRKVAVKVQYPGVAEGIDSDIDNLVSVLNFGGLFPKGMFLEDFIKVARKELSQECDYVREARAIRHFNRLLDGSKDYYVPKVIDELSSARVLTAEYVEGKPVDKCLGEPQVVRDYIASKFIELCLLEIFEWRFMQTDPNWSNFFLGKHPTTGEPRLVLLDFGASRSYPKAFVDIYMKIIRAAYDKDTDKILEHSRDIGFLTGYETEVMKQAHIDSVLVMGETLTSLEPYDFSRQSVTKRIKKLMPVMLEHRLKGPPEEIYSLHRKLSGSYLLATKLKAKVACGGLFVDICDRYTDGEDGKDINIDTVLEN